MAVKDFNKEYFFREEGDLKPELKSNESRMPDNYLEVKLNEVIENPDHKITIIPFPWSRDPDDTDKVIPKFETKLLKVYETYKDTGRPIHILAHSWGTVLMHETLYRLSKTNPELKINKFISVGAPLMPSNLIVKLFMAIEIKKEDLEKCVSKPSNVVLWKNFWAKRDLYSNTIKVADKNFQIDSKVKNWASILINLILHNKPLRKEAKNDLWKIRNFGAWHNAYIFDYKTILKSINKKIFVPVFKPLVVPQTITIAPLK